MAKQTLIQYLGLDVVGRALGNILTDLGSWVGLQEPINDLISSSFGKDWQNIKLDDAKTLGKLNGLLEKIANEYNISINDISERVYGVRNLPNSSILNKAKSQEIKELRDASDEIKSQYNKDYSDIQKAIGTMQHASGLTKAADRTSEAVRSAVNHAKDIATNIERRINNV